MQKLEKTQQDRLTRLEEVLDICNKHREGNIYDWLLDMSIPELFYAIADFYAHSEDKFDSDIKQVAQAMLDAYAKHMG